METPVTFGEWLRQSREALRLTRKEFAERVGCSVAMLRKIEGGERRPSAQIAELIASCLEVTQDDRPVFVKVARGVLNIERLSSISPWKSSPEYSLTPAAPRTNLPVLPTPLIGRQSIVEELCDLLRDPLCRLVTLTGPGGIGKTRLAIATAYELQPDFANGVYFIPLAAVNSARFIVPLIAEAVGFAFRHDSLISPKTQLFNYLQERQTLLITDNLEQLLAEPGIELLSELLEHAPQVKLLATSRESLALYSEWVYQVQGLPIPEAGLAGSTTQGTCVELFLQRARRADASFTASVEDYPAIVRICQLVDGIPLGIELAAAWVRTLTCGEIAKEIERGLDFLRLTTRDLPARHQSMRAVFDHSWKLLTEEERQVLLRLSVFRGGFDRPAAEAITEAELPALAALVTKSILRRSGAGRYDLHDLVRQYSAEKLTGQPAEKARTEAQHARYYLEAFGREAANLRSSAQQEALARLAAEMDNFRAAWDWAVTHGEFAQIEQTLRTFASFFDNLGWFQEGHDLLGRAVDELEAARVKLPPGRDELVALGHLLACQGLFAFRLAQNYRAQELLEQSLTILRPLNEPRLLVEAVTFLGIVMALTGNYSRALELFSEGLETAAQVGDRWFAALCLTEQTGTQVMMGRSENAYEHFTTAVAEWRAIGDPRFTAFALNFLSMSAFRSGRYTEARLALEESILLNRSAGDRWGLATAYRSLGLVEQAQDEHAAALVTFRESLDILIDLGAHWDAARVLAEMGRSVFALGDDPQAERLWMKSLQISTETQGPAVGLETLVGLASLRLKRGDHSGALELLSVVLNHPASVQETKTRAAELYAQATEDLSTEEIEAVQQRLGEKTYPAITRELFGQKGAA